MQGAKEKVKKKFDFQRGWFMVRVPDKTGEFEQRFKDAYQKQLKERLKARGEDFSDPFLIAAEMRKLTHGTFLKKVFFGEVKI